MKKIVKTRRCEIQRNIGQLMGGIKCTKNPSLKDKQMEKPGFPE